MEHQVPDKEANNPSRFTRISYGPIIMELSDVRFSCPGVHEQGVHTSFARGEAPSPKRK